jgi:hypothetical protein
MVIVACVARRAPSTQARKHTLAKGEKFLTSILLNCQLNVTLPATQFRRRAASEMWVGAAEWSARQHALASPQVFPFAADQACDRFSRLTNRSKRFICTRLITAVHGRSRLITAVHGRSRLITAALGCPQVK